MSFQTAKLYDLTANVIAIGSVRIGSFDEEGAVEYEMLSDEHESANSSDGRAPVYSRLNDERVGVTITLMETSPSVGYLDTLLRGQRAQRGSLLTVTYSHVDTISGDTISSPQAIFMNRPGPSKGRVAGTREFRLELPFGKRLMTLGGLNTPEALLP